MNKNYYDKNYYIKKVKYQTEMKDQKKRRECTVIA